MGSGRRLDEGDAVNGRGGDGGNVALIAVDPSDLIICYFTRRSPPPTNTHPHFLTIESQQFGWSRHLTSGEKDCGECL